MLQYYTVSIYRYDNGTKFTSMRGDVFLRFFLIFFFIIFFNFLKKQLGENFLSLGFLCDKYSNLLQPSNLLTYACDLSFMQAQKT